MANVIDTLELTHEEELEVFHSITMLLTVFLDPQLDIRAYLRSVICETLGLPEDTPDDQLQSTIHDMLPVYVARVHRDYGDRIDIEEFVRFVVNDMRNGSD